MDELLYFFVIFVQILLFIKIMNSKTEKYRNLKYNISNAYAFFIQRSVESIEIFENLRI